MKHRLRKLMLVLSSLFILISCTPKQQSPVTPQIHPSEQRMVQHERLRTYANAFQQLRTDEIAALWNSLNDELAMGLSLKKTKDPAIFSHDFLRLEAQMNANKNTVRSLTIIAKPQSERQLLTMLSSYSLLLVMCLTPQVDLQMAMQSANNTLQQMGLKGDLNVLAFTKLAARTVDADYAGATVTLSTHLTEQRFEVRFPLISDQSTLAAATTSERRTNLSYLYFGNPASYVNQINQTNNTLTMVSPNYLDLLSGGKLSVTWKLDASFIAEMKRRGIKVVPFLSNHWNRQIGIDALNETERVTDEVVAAVSAHQLDGVNIDIEGVGAAYRDAFTQFVRTLRNKLPPEKELSVAVAANPNGWRNGWHGFYDYPALSEVADYLMIMAYDESWEGSDPGPVSSLGFFERSLQFALNEGVARDKLVMGVPFYGRLWSVAQEVTANNGSTIKGIGVSNSRVSSLLERYDGQFAFDETKQSPYMKFDIPQGGGMYIAGKWCDSGQYILWYENERSLKQKLRMLARYGVKGAGSWSLYQEAAGTWDYFADWLNGRVFRDVALEHWAEQEIFLAAERGWMTGLAPEQFAPQQALTRAEATVILARFLDFQPSESKGTPSFSDVPQSHWAFGLIEAAHKRGIVAGTSSATLGTAKTFSPNAAVSREQLATLLVRALALATPSTPAEPPPPFTDIVPTRWSYEAIAAIYRSGIMSGMSGQTFAPSNATARAQMAVILNRLHRNRQLQ